MSILKKLQVASRKTCSFPSFLRRLLKIYKLIFHLRCQTTCLKAKMQCQKTGVFSFQKYCSFFSLPKTQSSQTRKKPHLTQQSISTLSLKKIIHGVHYDIVWCTHSPVIKFAHLPSRRST